MRNISIQSLIVCASIATFAAPTNAQAQSVNAFGGAFTSQSFQRPKPLGLIGVQSTPANMYNAAATKKILDSLKSGSMGTSQARLAPGDTVNVYYDSTGTYGWLGQLYSIQMANLLSHFNVKVNRLPVEQYTAGSMNNAIATFYLGVLYNNPLPTAFKTDAMSTTKPLCWMGYNLWQIAWNADNSWNTNFVNKFGMTFYFMDTLGYPTVSYKGQTLQKLQYDTTEGRVEITDTTKATRVATSTRPDGISIGYITKGANLWYVADNPFMYTTYNSNDDRILAFEDNIHDVLGSTAGVDHRAIIRVEDVSPDVPPATLNKIADTMAALNVPFVVSVIPSFQDPLGNETGKPQAFTMTSKPAFITALKYMQSKGGQIIMHGYTHQYSNLPNPYNAESADDFEFFRVTQNANGTQSYQGPVAEDTSAWAANRLTQGLNLLKNAGFTSVTGWVTPHYLASPTDYVEFQKKFAYSICRGTTFAQDTTGALKYVNQHSPWVYTDNFGMKRIPETIGYMDTDVYQGIPPHLPADLIKYAQANSVVRDGFAGMYYHWYLDTSLLTQLVTGVKALGYRFVMPAATLN